MDGVPAEPHLFRRGFLLLVENTVDVARPNPTTSRYPKVTAASLARPRQSSITTACRRSSARRARWSGRTEATTAQKWGLWSMWRRWLSSCTTT